jgi:hypothetical protein
VSLSKSAWTTESVSLAGIHPLAGKQRLAFVARDAVDGPDSLVEAAVDNLRLQEFECAMDPRCGVSEVAANSLLAVKSATGSEVLLSWDGSGRNGFNIHRTEEAELIPTLWEEPETLAARSRWQTLSDAAPPGPVVYYSVHASDCRSFSVP